VSKPFERFFRRRSKQEISLSEEGGIRYLHFGSVWIQGAMRLSSPYQLELEYTRELFAGLLFQPAPRDFGLVGLGAGSASKFAWKQFPRARVTTIELEEPVIACARANFSLPADSSRMRTVCDDGEAWLARHPDAYDYLIIDAYDAAARGPVLSSLEFYAHCRNALKADRISVLAVNLFGKHKSFNLNLTNIDRAFEGRMLVLPASERGNVIALGLVGPAVQLPVAELRTRAAALKEATGLNFQKWGAGIRTANAITGKTLEA
jgi:spermidine synthase